MSTTKPDETFYWIKNNAPLIADIYSPLAKKEVELMSAYDDVFKDAIRENTKRLLYSLVCIEFNRCTGVSTEEFYASIDADSLYQYVVRLEDFYDEDIDFTPIN